ncbi:thiamine diphosphokinase [Entomospira culicis]|uniref:Thiamine diphosphokinase n=1 Tax=Entomospira culicis TaxID=2719989 RepID=A0A968KVT6_9SPIO|nr:thiamine diphosphokinase [Entomospira culicis]NIZ19607.1 thiamine diphosphokinase [Entomospira culicis]NIZ69488.1 thiamine diphosphokinase [Entomospira culicis]WDI36603.1 thiamine diphosphokinase [Entomospira culicis]WDI38231.1 thiamine diphosphokinase [Entomospira culicis]
MISINADTLIFTGGNAPPADKWQHLVSPHSTIIAADSGLHQLVDTLHHPHHIIGDFDSLYDESLLKRYPQATIHRHPKAKDETDTELAVLLAQSLGAKSIALIGAGEGRIDHLFAITALFSQFPNLHLWLTACEQIIPIHPQKPLKLTLDIDTTISFYPLLMPQHPIKTEGLTWPFSNFDTLFSKMSLSNTTNKSIIKIEIADGILLSIIPFVI